MEIRTGTAPADETADVLVVGARAGREFDAVGDWVVDRLPWVVGGMDDAEFTGKEGQSFVAAGADRIPYRSVVFVGLGESADPEAVRRAAAVGTRQAARATVVATSLHAGDGGAVDEAVGFGFGLGLYAFDRHKSEPKPVRTSELVLVEGTEEAVAAARRGGVIASGVAYARDLVNEPAMEKPAARLADEVTAMAEEHGMSVRILDEDGIVQERLGGLHGVSLGATNPPRLVELRHDPEAAEAFLAFVGKGIVFDSGGLSLKPADAMETMKTDMAGAAAVFGAMRVISRLGLPVRVLAITPLTENMPGGSALRPGDVLTARNGKTIEVLNTDAEGRLVLADGLSLAAEEGPDLIVDVATLTGACKVALGERIAGLFGTDDAVERVRRAADAAGERVWPLPLPEDYRKQIDSEVADMKNTGGKLGGAITAALLLKEFVGEVPWAHLDIAGPARSSDAEHYLTKGGTGFGVRTLVELARQAVGA